MHSNILYIKLGITITYYYSVLNFYFIIIPIKLVILFLGSNDGLIRMRGDTSVGLGFKVG